MKVHITFRRITVKVLPGGGSDHFVVPGKTMTFAAEWAHVRDDCVVYRNPLDPPGREQHIPLANLYAFVIDRDREQPGDGTQTPGSVGGPEDPETLAARGVPVL